MSIRTFSVSTSNIQFHPQPFHSHTELKSPCIKKEWQKMERAIHSNLNPKSPTLREKNASFLSPHLAPNQPNKCEPHHAMSPSGFRAIDHDSTKSELSTLQAQKYINQVTNNDTIQKMTINNNSRVSPLHNMDTEHKHNSEQGDITKSTRSFSCSASSSLGGYANINNYKAHSFHAATPTPPPSSSSKASLNSKAGLLFHPKKSAISINPPQNPSDISKKIRTSMAKPIWLLRRNCPCNDKKSVQVKKNTQKPKSPITQTPSPQPQNLSSQHHIHNDYVNHKTSPTTSKKEVNPQRLFQVQPTMNQVPRPLSEAFTFPLILAKNTITKPQALLNVVHEEEDTPSRDSLQIFKPSSPSKSRAMDDDAASDASSDLFEIESFSTQVPPLGYPATPSIVECHEASDMAAIHDFLFAADTNSSLWQRRQLTDSEVPTPPL